MFLHIVWWRVSAWERKIKEGRVWECEIILRVGAYLVGVHIISHYTQTWEREQNNRKRTCRWKCYNQSGVGIVSTTVKQLTSNPLAISMSAISRNKTKQKQTIAIISALIVLVRSPECLLNRVIAVEIWIFNNRKRLERNSVWGEQQSVWTRWANEGN